jgi:hypothetical protein
MTLLLQKPSRNRKKRRRIVKNLKKLRREMFDEGRSKYVPFDGQTLPEQQVEVPSLNEFELMGELCKRHFKEFLKSFGT